MNAKKMAARILVALTGLMFVCSVVPVGDSLRVSGAELSQVEIWVDRGCGAHYRMGEPFLASFKITSPGPRAIVAIRSHKSGTTEYLFHRAVFTTNEVHSLPWIAKCPAGLEILEILVLIPPYSLPSDMGVQYTEEIRLSDTCHFYTDPPCTGTDTDQDGFYIPYDCDDANPLIHPGAEEVCDGRDNDCDTLTDEGCFACHADWDKDTFPECEDCDDDDHTVHPFAAELCDGKDNNCNGLIDEGCCTCYYDFDRDGYSECWDCSDDDPTVYPGAPELCDGKDNDCDGFIDEGGPCDYVEIKLGSEETLYIDRESVEVSFTVHSRAPTAVVNVIDYHAGVLTYMVSGRTVTTNEPHHLEMTAHCPQGLDLIIITAFVISEGKTVTLADDCSFYVTNCRTIDNDNDGYDKVPEGTDCDDDNPEINPGAEEVCDRKDNDCDGLIDEGTDCDYVEIWVDKGCGEFYNDRDTVSLSFVVHSSASTARVTVTVYPPQELPRILAADKLVETNKELTLTALARCGGLETILVTATVVVGGAPVTLDGYCSYYIINCKKPDDDNDGYASVLVGGNDCDDADPTVNPGALELCDGKDNNCDGLIDEPDNDKDGHISADCGGGDCDDLDPSVYPGAEEVFDGKDNDCDQEIDEGITMEQVDDDLDGYSLNLDCNDKNPAINPGAQEVCNDGIDNDCDGRTDCDDEDCRGDRSCRQFDMAEIFSLTRIRALASQYWYLLVGLVAVIAGLIFYLWRRRKKKLAEKVGPPPPGERFALPSEPIKKKEPFWRSTRR